MGPVRDLNWLSVINEEDSKLVWLHLFIRYWEGKEAGLNGKRPPCDSQFGGDFYLPLSGCC
jgi:hypothetical protein